MGRHHLWLWREDSDVMLSEEEIDRSVLYQYHRVVEWVCVTDEWKDETVLHLERGSQNIHKSDEWIDGLVLWSIWFIIWEVFRKDIGIG